MKKNEKAKKRLDEKVNSMKLRLINNKEEEILKQEKFKQKKFQLLLILFNFLTKN